MKPRRAGVVKWFVPARLHPAAAMAQRALDLLEAGPDLGQLGLDRRPAAEVGIDGAGDRRFVVDQQTLQPAQGVGAGVPVRGGPLGRGSALLFVGRAEVGGLVLEVHAGILGAGA